MTDNAFKRFVNRMLGAQPSDPDAPAMDQAGEAEPDNGFEPAPDQPFAPGPPVDPTFPSMGAPAVVPPSEVPDETAIELERLNAMHERGEISDDERDQRVRELRGG